MPDENDDVTAGVQVIRRKNARPGVNAISSQSRVSRHSNRVRRVEIGFLDTKSSGWRKIKWRSSAID